MNKEVICKVPGKFIITGEHSVVFGKPSLATTIDKYCTATLNTNSKNNIILDLKDLNGVRKFNINEIIDLSKISKKKYAEYTTFLIALNLFFKKVEIQPEDGINIEIKSEIPNGSGFGSSSAVITSLIVGLNKFYDTKLSKDQLFNLTHQVESSGDGKSSGSDPFTVLNGGVCKYQNGIGKSLDFLPPGFILVDTGTPASSTNQCVTKVMKNFKQDNAIWSKFEICSNSILEAIKNNNKELLKKQIRINNQLLIQIGVVPQKVIDFINSLPSSCAAKISGAGSITGNNAGLVLIFNQENEDIILPESYKIINCTPLNKGAEIV